MAEWIDVTMPLRPDMAIWPGDPVFSITPEADMAAGDSCNLARLSLSTHTGTHMDAPWHFIPGGARVDEADPALFFGRALVLDLPDTDLVRAADLPGAPLPERLLLKTRNSLRLLDAPFDPDFVAVAPDAAERMVADGVRLLGVDGFSIGAFRDSGPTHHILLGAGVFAVEGLRLAVVPGGWCEFVALPLLVAGGDGAPCRAFVRVL